MIEIKNPTRQDFERYITLHGTENIWAVMRSQKFRIKGFRIGSSGDRFSVINENGRVWPVEYYTYLRICE